MTMRGVRKPGAVTVTSAVRGLMRDDPHPRRGDGAGPDGPRSRPRAGRRGGPAVIPRSMTGSMPSARPRGRQARSARRQPGEPTRTRLRSTWSSSGADPGARRRPDPRRTTVEALARAAGRSLEREEAEALDRSLREAVGAWLGAARRAPRTRRHAADGARGPWSWASSTSPRTASPTGGLYGPGGHPQTAVEHARRLLGEGADLLDVGGESTRPGADEVPEAEELARVVPVVEGLEGRAVVSIDTTKPEVAREAVDAGAVIVNDVSGAADPALLEAVAGTGAAYVLMHTRGTPKDMRSPDRLRGRGRRGLRVPRRGPRALRRGRRPHPADLLDPGLGFAKTSEHNVALLRALRQFRGLGRPVVSAPVRKSFLGELLGGGPGGPAGGEPGVGAAAAVPTPRSCACTTWRRPSRPCARRARSRPATATGPARSPERPSPPVRWSQRAMTASDSTAGTTASGAATAGAGAVRGASARLREPGAGEDQRRAGEGPDGDLLAPEGNAQPDRDDRDEVGRDRPAGRTDPAAQRGHRHEGEAGAAHPQHDHRQHAGQLERGLRDADQAPRRDEQEREAPARAPAPAVRRSGAAAVRPG